MSKYVLFSPIGDTDPIRGNYDGAMLHIVRHYKPHTVYLFLSKEMVIKNQQDNRYELSIKKIIPECNVEKINTDIEDAHNFDKFIDSFNEIINQIKQTHLDSEILLNLSSGTPQMKSNLALEAVTSAYNLIPVQVSTPARKSNDKTDIMHEFDIEHEFKNLKDNLPEVENRCSETPILSFKKAQIKSQIKSLIEQYDYSGALKLFDENLFKNKNILSLLNHAKYRLNLQQQEAVKSIENIKLDFDFYPIKEQEINYFIEYFYVMKIKQLKGELSDFILKVTPFLTELLKLYISRYFDLEKIIEIKRENGKEISYITRSLLFLNEKPLLDFLDDKFRGYDKTGQFRDTFINTSTLNIILDYVSKNSNLDQKVLCQLNEIKNLFGSFSEIEKNIRNLTAHEMVSVTEELIKAFNGQKDSTKVIFNLEKLLLKIFPKEFNKEDFIYNKINKLIIDNLD